MILLFELMTAEMWPDLLHLASDAYSDTEGVVTRFKLHGCTVTWVLVGCLFIGNFSSDASWTTLINCAQMPWPRPPLGGADGVGGGTATRR